VTYPDAGVERAIAEGFVPVRLEGGKFRDLARQYNVRWFPALVVADAEGRATHQTTGFLPPRDLCDELDYGRAIHAMAEKRYDVANRLFGALADRREAERAPEAVYWWGISKMRETKDPSAALPTWKLIPERWPRSQFARKVAYALTPKKPS